MHSEVQRVKTRIEGRPRYHVNNYNVIDNINNSLVSEFKEYLDALIVAIHTVVEKIKKERDWDGRLAFSGPITKIVCPFWKNGVKHGRVICTAYIHVRDIPETAQVLIMYKINENEIEVDLAKFLRTFLSKVYKVIPLIANWTHFSLRDPGEAFEILCTNTCIASALNSEHCIILTMPPSKRRIAVVNIDNGVIVVNVYPNGNALAYALKDAVLEITTHDWLPINYDVRITGQPLNLYNGIIISFREQNLRDVIREVVMFAKLKKPKQILTTSLAISSLYFGEPRGGCKVLDLTKLSRSCREGCKHERRSTTP